MKKFIVLGCGLMVLLTATTYGQLPKIIEKNGRHTLLVDGKPYFLLGGQAHNSGCWPAMLPNVWAAIDFSMQTH